jgi:hypothetical protein
LLHRQAVLLRAVPAEGLRAGDVGMIVLVYAGGRHLEVEFINAEGFTQAVLTLPSDHLLPLQRAVPLPLEG